jgi:hypothetical protein
VICTWMQSMGASSLREILWPHLWFITDSPMMERALICSKYYIATLDYNVMQYI